VPDAFFHAKGSFVTLQIGDRAPEFTARTQTGETVSLSDFVGKKTLVLYFYPKDDTPGCTAEACSFRDNHQMFLDAGAVVLGVSADSDSSHGAFAKKHSLPFSLVSDESGDLRAKYGVKSTLGLFPGRVTYVIDRRGIVKYVFSSQIRFNAHVEKALEIVKELEGAAATA
jgi:peroxiredoxin Q/BCP